MAHFGLTTGRAAEYMGRHPKTLQALDRKGILPAHRTATHKRYGLREELDAYLGQTSVKVPRRWVAYCRVSSPAQRPDFKNQRRLVEPFSIAQGLAHVEFIEEIGGGLNFKRPKFTALGDAILTGQIEALILAHQDRLARFGFDLWRHLGETDGCPGRVINVEEVSPEPERVEDWRAITHCFWARLYGLGNYRKALKAALK